MVPSQWLSLAACGGILILAFVVLLRGARNPLSLPLGLLCIDMFVWNFATLAYKVSGEQVWLWLDTSFSPFTPPLVLHVVLAFVGLLRRLRWLLIPVYLGYSVLSLGSAVFLFVPAEKLPGLLAFVHGHAPGGLSWWSTAYIGGWLPLLVLELVLLVRHLKHTTDLGEQMRGRLMVAAVLVGSLLGATEFWDEVVAIPALGHVGALASMSLVAIIVLRFKLFGRELPLVTLLYAGALAALAVFGYLAVFHWLGTRTALLVVATGSLTLVLLGASWDVVASLVGGLTRMRSDAALGRIAAQLAHDLKNPLTSVGGGLRFLIKEREAGRSIDDQQEYLDMMLEQVQRISRVLKKYPLLPDVPPVMAPVDIHQVADEVLSGLSARIEGRGIAVQRELGQVPRCQADEDLVAGALENVIQNALQAMEHGGTLTVRSACEAGRVVVTVEDTGHGMDPRQRALAFDRHFTTRTHGSGLGLAWVRRVLQAHGGSVELDSELGQGTTVRLALPLHEEIGDEQKGGNP